MAKYGRNQELLYKQKQGNGSHANNTDEKTVKKNIREKKHKVKIQEEDLQNEKWVN